jgi:predicted Zn-dependent protease
MALLSEQQAKKIIDTVLALSKADETSVTINGGRTGNIRYARNTISTSGETDNLTLTVTCVFGKKSGSATTNELDAASMKKVVRQAEDTARLAPENPEYVSMLGPQQYAKGANFAQTTAGITPQFRADAAAASIHTCVAKKLVAAGYLEDESGFIAIGNNKGLFGYNQDSSVDFTVTVRTPDGKGSGFAVQNFTDASRLNSKTATETAAQKAIASASAVEMPPGKYTVILEPAALAGFIAFFLAALDARNADEGRSYFSKKEEGTKLGEALFSEKLTLYSDPSHPDVPGAPFIADGRPLERVAWVENGVLKNLAYSRYWAEKKGVKATPAPGASGSIILQGGNQSLDDMIHSTTKGILVTRTWYMRMVDPQNVSITGLTRDGVFYIENGTIKHAVKNFRFNESPMTMFRNLEAIGTPVRIGNSLIPPLKIRDFNFTSLSDAV